MLRRACTRTDRLADLNRKTDDSHFIAANEWVLRVHLPDSDHATDDAAGRILTAEIESTRPKEAIPDPVVSLFAEEQPHVLISSPAQSTLPRPKLVIPRPVINQNSHGRRNGLVHASRSDESFDRHLSSLDHKTQDRLWNLNTTFQPALAPPNVVLRDDSFYGVPDLEDKDNEHIDMSVGDWHNDGNLSHDFTADDCENLVAMLDVASS